MKILYVYETVSSSGAIRGGSTTHNLNTIQSLRNLGHDVLEVIPGQSDKTIDKSRYRYNKIKTIFPLKIVSKIRDIYSIYYDYKFISILKDKIERYKPDVIFERETVFHQSCSFLAKKFNIPYIVEIHSAPEERKWMSYDNFNWIANYIQNKTAKRANAIIVVALPMGIYLKNKGINEKKIFYIPNAVNPKLFRVSEKSNFLKKKMKLEDKVIIGFVGSMKKYHGIDILIKASYDVLRTHQNIKFLIVGHFENDNEKTKLTERLNVKGILNSFIFTGQIKYEDIPIYIGIMDICVIPNALWNGTPIKTFEYGAMGKPIILPKMKHLLELVKLENALFSEPHNPENLANNIVKLIEQKELRQLLGNNLKNLILSEHTWDKNAKRIVNIASNIMKQPG